MILLAYQDDHKVAFTSVSDVLMAPTIVSTITTVIVGYIGHVGAKKHGQCLLI